MVQQRRAKAVEVIIVPERALLNRSEFDVEMGTTHELPPDREAFAPGGRTAIASLGASLGGEWVL